MWEKGTQDKKVWELFENLNEYVYVSDVETDELVYVNGKTRELLKQSAGEDVLGRKCYEVLQGCDSPCSMCNNADLKLGEFIEWEYYNPRLDKYLIIKDTLIESEGRKYRLEFAFDVGKLTKQARASLDYENLDSIINEGFRTALQADTPGEGIDIVLEYLGSAINAERTYIFERNEKGNDDNTHEWTAPGVSAEIDNLQDVDASVCSGWYKRFEVGGHVVISNLEDIREEDPELYSYLEPQNITSLVVMPLYDKDKILGFYGVDNPEGENFENASNMLQTMAYFLVSLIKRRDLLSKLSSMSYEDQLTGLGNRYAMREYSETVRPNQSVGIVYGDITGLKQMNDTLGHEAGDILIKSACTAMKETFEGYGVFRMGGDEILVICPGIGEYDFKRLNDVLRRNVEARDITVAMGTEWRPEAQYDIEYLIQRAEEKMYQNKNDYYRRTGRDRRH